MTSNRNSKVTRAARLISVGLLALIGANVGGCGATEYEVVDQARAARITRPVAAWVAYETAPGSEVYDEAPAQRMLQPGQFVITRRARPATAPSR